MAVVDDDGPALFRYRQIFTALSAFDAAQCAQAILRDGSEIALPDVYEPFRLNYATDGAAVLLASTDPADVVADDGFRLITIPANHNLVIVEVNYEYEEGAGGDLDDAIDECLLALNVNDVVLSNYPQHMLRHYRRSANGLMFGPHPIFHVVPTGQRVRIRFTPSGTAGSLVSVFPSLTVRYELTELLQLAGFIT